MMFNPKPRKNLRSALSFMESGKLPLVERQPWTPQTHMIAALRAIGRVNAANKVPSLIAQMFPNAALLYAISDGIRAEARARSEKAMEDAA